MLCPKCHSVEDKVIDTRVMNNGETIRRRRQCLNCNFRFTTHETIIPVNITTIIKRDGRREEFNPNKLREGIRMACWKRNISTEILERHKGDPTQTVRMKAHYNGHDFEQYPDALRPFLDMMHDKTGEPNAIEDIYFKIITCYSFTFRNVLTGKLDTGIIVEPSADPELIIPMGKTGGIISGMKDRIKKINNFFGNIGKTDNFKDNEDLRRTIRLLIAIAVADGNVSDDEKQSLTLSIRNIDQLTNSDCDELLKLLSMNDSSFLTDDDFKFHSHENAEVTLNRMQEIATADGNVDDTERDIIERLKFKY